MRESKKENFVIIQNIKFSIILLFVIFFLSQVNNHQFVLAQNNNTVLNYNGFMNGTPAYSVQSFIEKSSYDPGEKVIISVYFTGAGKVDEAQICGHIPKKLVNNDEVSLFCIDFLKIKDTQTGWSGFLPNPPYEMNKLPSRFSGLIDSGYFTLPQERLNVYSELEIQDSDQTYKPPILIEFIYTHAIDLNYSMGNFFLFYG